MQMQVTNNWLPVLGVVISILAWYIPGFNKWYEALKPEFKQLFMLGAMLVITLSAVGLSALGFLDVYSGATWQEWVWYPLVDFVAAMVLNTSTYKATNRIFEKK